jgi:hypothetical protein
MDKRGSLVLGFITFIVLVALLALSYTLVPEEFQFYILVFSIAFIFLGLIFFLHQMLSKTVKLRNHFKKVKLLFNEASSTALKEEYMLLYKLYVKLPEKKKRNFYAALSKVREKIESQLKAEKHIYELLEKANMADFDQKKKLYEKIFNMYESLPDSVKELYFSRIVHLKEQLGRGH